RALIKGGWKYIRNYFERTEELYNLERDPMEVQNLSFREPEVTKTMREELSRRVEEGLSGRPDPMWTQVARWAENWVRRFGRHFFDLRPKPTIIHGVDD
ncbi:hypothetical protein DRO55_02885, partial [Candidatus Bathyarchaeota archaeon]